MKALWCLKRQNGVKDPEIRLFELELRLSYHAGLEPEVPKEKKRKDKQIVVHVDSSICKAFDLVVLGWQVIDAIVFPSELYRTAPRSRKNLRPG